MTQKIFVRKAFLKLSLTFIFFTVTGTLLHESGHYIVAKYLGYSVGVHYKYTQWNSPVEDSLVESIYSKYGKEMRYSDISVYSKIVNAIEAKTRSDSFWICLGGPLQTMVTGSVAFMILIVKRKNFENLSTLSLKYWALIFLSLFWLRQTANFILQIIFNSAHYKYSNNDERFLAEFLQLPQWFFSAITAIIGVMILAKIMSTFIPIKFRSTFIMAGASGGFAGYILWFKVLGPVLLP